MKVEKIHFIAIGGSVMASLAIALKDEGHCISGSDDRIYNPSAARLRKKELFPEQMGWFPHRIDKGLDKVILGMHAKKDNPELQKAQQLGTPVYSFPEYILSRAQDKQRIVIGGSHGKTTITALLIHALLFHRRNIDYVVGAQFDGIANTVRLADAPVIIIEGDEYPCSALDGTPKFIAYRHHIGVISGVAWDHANIFPSKTSYTKAFTAFADATPKGGVLIYNAEEPACEAIAQTPRKNVITIPYKACPYTLQDGSVTLHTKHGAIPVQLIGAHNMQNIAAAQKIAERMGLPAQQFYEALPHFKGAAGRLQRTFCSATMAVYRDFAHSPSKVRASIKAVKQLYPDWKLVGCLELHTLSSSNKSFLSEYSDSMNACSKAVVYCHPSAMDDITEGDIRHAFNQKELVICTDREALTRYITAQPWVDKALLMMSSGSFDALDIPALVKQITNGQNPSAT